MLRDINVSLSDGALASSSTATGIHAKIGVSTKTATEAIVIRSSMSVKRIKELLGYSPLADAVMDSIENGSNLIYCIPVAATSNGTISEVTSTATGDGTLAATGTPYNAYSVLVKITAAGGLNAAAYKYSLDGGSTFSDVATVPSNGVVSISEAGLTITFTAEAGGEGFAVGDKFSFSTTAPAMSNESIITALGKVRAINTTVEFAHIVGSSSAALWSSCNTIAQSYHTTYKKPLFIICEATAPTSGQTADAYATQMVSARSSVNSIYVGVVTARGTYKRMDGISSEINLAGVICGLISQANPQQSIGETKTFSIPDDKLTGIAPADIADETETLDTAGYITVRRYEGLSGWYVTNARLICPEGSDYKYIERIRVTNKIVREVRKQLLTQLQTTVDISDQERELSAIAELAMAPLDTMADRKEISSARIVVPEGQDLLSSESLSLLVRYVPVGHIREIEVDLGMENPYKTES